MLGMRQCGKTYTLKEFGRKHYEDETYFDFERNPQLSNIFRDLDPNRIIKELSAANGRRITERTLIIFDEIQHCYAALSSLKYFCQEMPGYHIVCAGSLLSLALANRSPTGKDAGGIQDRNTFPAGKVNFIRMWPMDFGEFILATEGEEFFGMIDGIPPREEIPAWAMERLESSYGDYLMVGGMPESVQTWIGTKDLVEVRRVQNEMIRSFREDMGKYSGFSYQKVVALWDSAAYQAVEAGNRFFLKKAGGTTKTLADPLQWLLDAGLLKRAWEVNDDSIPRIRGAESITSCICRTWGFSRVWRAYPRSTSHQQTAEPRSFAGPWQRTMPSTK